MLCDETKVGWVVGDVMLMLEGGPLLPPAVSCTVALADLVGSATLVAVMVTDCAVLITEGAV